MSSICFAFNFNIQRCEVEVGAEGQIISEGYWPLLKSLSDRDIKSNLYMSGYTTNRILEIDPSLRDYIAARLGSLLRIGSYTYTHPIPQLLTVPELMRQIKRGISIDEKVYGVKIKGFFPPEFAFTRQLIQLLWECSVEYVIVLSSLLGRNYPETSEAECYKPYAVALDAKRALYAVPVALDLPEAGKRFFKRMLLGEISPQKASNDLFSFLDSHDDIFVVLERDAETLYVDELNSGARGTRQRFERFLDLVSENAARRNIPIVSIEEHLAQYPPERFATISDYLGNTKIETFTEGPSRELWERTKAIQQRLLAFEGRMLPAGEEQLLEEAWENMLLAHNSDGRIGFWYSDWKPGEHQAVQSRRDFIEKHLDEVVRALNRLEER
jgi:hypothetical protein